MVESGDSWYKVKGYSSNTVAWIPSDTEENFHSNMANPLQRAKIEEAGWTEQNISYTFNAHGFRSEEFGDGESVMFLGCSLTAGVGVDLESSWAHIVSESLGLRRYNLGVGGGSADMCFRLAAFWIPRLRPRYVCMLTPNVGRMEILTEDDDLLYLPNRAEEEFYLNWLSNDVNMDMNRLKNQIGIRHICEENDAKLFEITVEDTMAKRMVQGKNTWARDLMHPGREWNVSMAQDFLTLIKGA
jgi:hypothetical protein